MTASRQLRSVSTTVNLDGIPASMKAADRWILWKPAERGGKPTKIPCDAAGNQVSVTDRSNWLSFDRVAQLHERNGYGVGFVLGDGWVGVDLDNCLNGKLHVAAQAVVDDFATYTELSPSGTGLKLILYGEKPNSRCKTTKVDWDGALEIYDRGRFFTITGRAKRSPSPEPVRAQAALERLMQKYLPSPSASTTSSTPAAPVFGRGFAGSDEELLERMFASKNGETIRALYNGDDSAHKGDTSGADMAFVSHLAFWTGPERERIARLWRASKRYRAKLDRDDYVNRTIDAVLDSKTDFYDGPAAPIALPTVPATSASNGWLDAVDLLAFDGLPQETPEIAGLFYPGRRILVSGASESAKTWAGMAAAVSEISVARDVLWIDTDGMGERSILERLRVLNAHDDAIRAHFHYRSPSGPLSSEAQAALISSLDGRLVVCDSFNATMTLHGLDPNKGPEVEAFYQRVVDPFCRAGLAFVILDHVPKAARADTPYAIGSERKHSGAYLHLGFEVIGDQYVTRDGVGRSKIRTKKDRGAYFVRPDAGIFRLEIVAGSGNWQLEPPRHDPSWKPSTIMEQVSMFVEQCDEPPYKKNIEDAKLGKATYVRDAIARLVKGKYLREVPGKRKDTVRYVSDRPYRESDDEVVPNSSQVVPNEHRVLAEQVVPSSPSKGTTSTTANPDPEASRPAESSQVDPVDEPPTDPKADW